MELPLTRRGFLSAGALGVGALAVGGVLADTLTAEAAVPSYFDVGQSGGDAFGPVKLSEPDDGWQSMSVDQVNGRIYYSQAPNRTPGNMRISYLQGNGATISATNYMQFDNFGHGQAIGIERLTNDTYIWMECDPPAGSHTGTKFCRVKWREHDGHSYTLEEAMKLDGFEMYNLVPDSVGVCCTIDPEGKRLLIRYAPKAHQYQHHYRVFDLESVKQRKAKTLYPPHSETTLLQHVPATNSNGKPRNFQGMAIYGDYGYLLTGHEWFVGHGDGAHTQCRPPSGDKGDIHLTVFDLRTGKSKSARTTAHYTYNYREPEGLAVQLANEPRLLFGIVDEQQCATYRGNKASDKHTMSVSYKNVMSTKPL
ncbi:hypothetical protein [Jatrophihabitans endophyticus]|uniref:phage baseplate protein n=1 Tax=Jatrophihabitans endophyticus TaxID=1206085 RepID=UPI001A0A981E|nr:hypothetical protein [Jatrophihabitans endophyticus]MBE7187537.1 hypothetical protein [Jatrophihabitans endophyticus]